MTKILSKSQSKKSAFSLIELSLVLVIIAIIISGAITVSESAIKNAKAKITRDRMEIIKEALNTFVYTNKRLPCPASLHNVTTDVAYGAEVISGVNCTFGSGGVFDSASSTGTNLIYGAVPVKTLGLSIEFLGDGFDNKFSYVVPLNLTKTYVGGGASGFEGTDMTNPDNDPITIRETVSTGSNITTISVYALISHGINGSGSFNINSGTTQNALSGDPDEDSNSATGTLPAAGTYDNTFVINSGSATFDDIVAYNVRETLVQQIGGFSTTVCPAETSTYTDPCTGTPISFPATPYNTLGQGDDFCPTYACFSDSPPPITGEYPSRRCGLNGKWETPVEFPCHL